MSAAGAAKARGPEIWSDTRSLSCLLSARDPGLVRRGPSPTVKFDCCQFTLGQSGAGSHLCPPARLRAKLGGRQANGIGVEPVDEAGRRLGLTLFVAPTLGGCGDIESIEVPACERARGALSRRQQQLLAEHSLSGIALDASATIDRHPNVAVPRRRSVHRVSRPARPPPPVPDLVRSSPSAGRIRNA